MMILFAALYESAIGLKQTSASAPHMSACDLERRLMSVDLNYWRGGRPSKAGTPSAMRWKG